MELFEMVNGYVMPSVHALMIEPFKSIWEKDTSDNNVESIKVLTYIELMCSPKKSNPFHGYSEEERPSKVKQEVWKDKNHPTTMDMLNGVIKYKELLADDSASYALYISAVNGVQKLRQFLDTFSMDERTPNGAMVLKPADVTRAYKDLDDVAKNMEAARDRVHTEIVQSAKTRNQRNINEFER